MIKHGRVECCIFQFSSHSTVDTCTSCTAQLFLELNKIFISGMSFSRKFMLSMFQVICSIQVDIMFHYCMPFSLDLSIVHHCSALIYIYYTLTESKSSLKAFSIDPIRKHTCMQSAQFSIQEGQNLWSLLCLLSSVSKIWPRPPACIAFLTALILHLYRRKQTDMSAFIFRCSTFHLTYKHICVCISQYLCLHFLTFVLAFLNICHIMCLCIYPDLLDICGYIYGTCSTDVLIGP